MLVTSHLRASNKAFCFSLEIVVEPWIDGLWEAFNKCPFVKISKKKSSKIFESNVIEHVELKSDQMDSNQIDELFKRLSDVTLNGTDTR